MFLFNNFNKNLWKKLTLKLLICFTCACWSVQILMKEINHRFWILQPLGYFGERETAKKSQIKEPKTLGIPVMSIMPTKIPVPGIQGKKTLCKISGSLYEQYDFVMKIMEFCPHPPTHLKSKSKSCILLGIIIPVVWRYPFARTFWLGGNALDFPSNALRMVVYVRN